MPIDGAGRLGAKRLQALLLSWKVADVFLVSTKGGLEGCELSVGRGDPGTRGWRSEVDATDT